MDLFSKRIFYVLIHVATFDASLCAASSGLSASDMQAPSIALYGQLPTYSICTSSSLEGCLLGSTVLSQGSPG